MLQQQDVVFAFGNMQSQLGVWMNHPRHLMVWVNWWPDGNCFSFLFFL